MFTAQIMYAEGLAKILNLILRVRNYERQQEKRIVRLRREVDVLERAEAVLKELPHGTSLTVVGMELANQWRIVKEEQEQYAFGVSELRRIGVAPAEYEEKFRLISLDCLRISHGTVHPPLWEAA